MSNSADGKCGTCRFLFHSSCRRHPLTLYIEKEKILLADGSQQIGEEGNPLFNMSISGVWPPVGDDTWCGEYIPAKGKGSFQ